MRRNLFKSMFKKKQTPSQRLYKALLDNGGFEKNIKDKNGKLHKIESDKPSNEYFELRVKSCEDESVVFNAVIMYGVDREDKNKNIIYIEKFGRQTEEAYGIGKEVAKFIREIAEKYRFQYIQCNAVATFNPMMKYLEQEKLEEFYFKYMNGKKVIFEIVPNSDHIDFFD